LNAIVFAVFHQLEEHHYILSIIVVPSSFFFSKLLFSKGLIDLFY
jgi:hypothetical protein